MVVVMPPVSITHTFWLLICYNNKVIQIRFIHVLFCYRSPDIQISIMSFVGCSVHLFHICLLLITKLFFSQFRQFLSNLSIDIYTKIPVTRLLFQYHPLFARHRVLILKKFFFNLKTFTFNVLQVYKNLVCICIGGTTATYFIPPTFFKWLN